MYIRGGARYIDRDGDGQTETEKNVQMGLDLQTEMGTGVQR